MYWNIKELALFKCKGRNTYGIVIVRVRIV